MHIVVCAKAVLDPDGVNSYALWGRLEVDASGSAFETGGSIMASAAPAPRLLNSRRVIALRRKNSSASFAVSSSHMTSPNGLRWYGSPYLDYLPVRLKWVLLVWALPSIEYGTPLSLADLGVQDIMLRRLDVDRRALRRRNDLGANIILTRNRGR